MKNLCYEHAEYKIKLIQTGLNQFTVEYGKQIRTKMGYFDAADELGTCLMHALACAGKIKED